jgi:5-methylcytosine-specific restriction endonuclease McrA
VAYNDETESAIVLGCLPGTTTSAYTYRTFLHHRVFFPSQEPCGLSEQFESHGLKAVWCREVIRDVDDNGMDYAWTATVCGPTIKPTLWAPRFAQRSERRRRATKLANSAAARARVLGIKIEIERVDPCDIYERDNWLCQLCGTPVDRTKRHPHLDSPSPDHIIPISRGGPHTAENFQTGDAGSIPVARSTRSTSDNGGRFRSRVRPPLPFVRPACCPRPGGKTFARVSIGALPRSTWG